MMNLEVLDVTLSVVTPVHVGNGKEISKKVYLKQGDKVAVTDPSKLYECIAKKGKRRQFEEYLLGNNNRMTLDCWIRTQNISPGDLQPSIRYYLPNRDYIGTNGNLQIMEFIKDSFGMAYIPGSTLKGMLRTVIQAARIMENPEKYRQSVAGLYQHLEDPDKRRYYLQKNDADFSMTAFYTLNRPTTKKWDKVNDELSGLIVSDSDPIHADDLILTQRLEHHINGTEKPLNILRESICPGTTVSFRLTIDKSLCSVTRNELEAAIEAFGRQYNNNFVRLFRLRELESDEVLIGGGTGFVSKTILYPALGYEDGVNAAVKVFNHTISGKARVQHRHNEIDRRKGVSPHIIKCTKYAGKTVQMGICKIGFTPQA